MWTKWVVLTECMMASERNSTCPPCCAPICFVWVQGANYNKALAQNVAAEKVQMYGQAFERIQQATGIEEIDQVGALPAGGGPGCPISRSIHSLYVHSYVDPTCHASQPMCSGCFV
jgi:hypothetical protein